jgi:hypothetical protein
MVPFVLCLWGALAVSAGYGQQADVRPATKVNLPTTIDGNTPFFWINGVAHFFSSTGEPSISWADPQTGQWTSQLVDIGNAPSPIWLEAAWVDEDGTLFIWYHHEPGGVCGRSSLTAPEIGAAVSYDGGRTIQDLGTVLRSGDFFDCNAKNGFFAGGHGDFSVVPDRENGYFYFLFTNYGGPLENQGVSIARMAFQDRFNPVDTVMKYFEGGWSEPGVSGRTTPIFPAVREWQREDADSFWGPSVHWNSYLNQYVVLLNRACCATRWPQEGVYISYNHDLSQPEAWSPPQKILTKAQINHAPGYYPQVVGLGEYETDSFAGQTVRLFVHGVSSWEIVFE